MESPFLADEMLGATLSKKLARLKRGLSATSRIG
jgi:hypothetical protein